MFAALTVTLALTTGILALAAGLLRLGFVANFISEPVLKGFIDVTAARMLSQLTADLRQHGVRLVLAGEIGQVRDMLAAVTGRDGTPEYHRTVQDAVTSARTGPAGATVREA